jgi:hypothetical protein
VSILPKSGKSGYLIGVPSAGGTVVIPIYSWNFGQSSIRPTYRTSRSSMFPVRTKGVVDETLTIRGVNPLQNDWLNTLIIGDAVNFQVGWHDLSVTPKKRRYVNFRGCLTEIRDDFIYSQTNQPGYSWQVSFYGTTLSKELLLADFLPFEGDSVVCFNKSCEMYIQTSDSEINYIIKHVQSASLVQTLVRQQYKTSRSNMRNVEQRGVRDYTASLVVEGDFDYWITASSFNALGHTYSFHYGPTLGEAVTPPKPMVVESITNLNVDVRTGELIRATVNLGVAG